MGATSDWFRIPRLSEAERQEVLDTLMVRPSAAALRRFAVLMSLAAMVAAIGLLQNSAATVIGAMVIAPMMAPIMGVAASVVMGWGGRLLAGLALVLLSASGVVVLGWAFALALPASGTELPQEVLARSSPDVRDLLVALGAGAAGALATVRKDVSGALPGVAVAVALVTPLATVGVLLGREQPELARGAVLLFLTNLACTVLVASVVFLLTGLVPVGRFRARRRQILISLVVVAIPTLVVGAVLTPRFLAVASQAQRLKIATQTLSDLLGPDSTLTDVQLVDTTVRADITSPTAPPGVESMTEALTRALGSPVTVELGWIALRDPATADPKASSLPLSEVGTVVKGWLDEQSLSLQELSYQAGNLAVTSAGPQPPKRSDTLADAIAARFGHRPSISMSWTHSAATSDSRDSALATTRTVVTKWTEGHPGINVLDVSGKDSGVTITLVGSTKPAVDDLQAKLRAALPQTSFILRWVAGGVLTTSTPTSPQPTP